MSDIPLPRLRMPIRQIDPNEVLRKPLITPRELHDTGVLNLSLNGIYQAIQRGEIECVTFGGKKKQIVTASLRRQLGLEPTT